MVVNRKNFIFRMCILFSIVILFYIASHLCCTFSTQIKWLQLNSEESKKSSGFINVIEYAILPNETQKSTIEGKIIEDLKSLKIPSPVPSTNNSSSNIVVIANVESEAEWQEAISGAKTNNESLNILDENAISDATNSRLLSLLACHDKDFLPEYLQRGEYWVLKNYVRAHHGDLNCHESITYTTHASFEFFDNVKSLVERWLAPVSLAVYAPGTDMVPTLNSIRYLRDCLGTDLIKLFVTFHIFFENKHISKDIPDPKTFLASSYNCSLSPPYLNVKVKNTYKKRKKLLYPVNVARNIARDAALTHFILASDIELYPSPNLVPQFLNMIARNASPLNNSTNPRVFPIALFEVYEKVKMPSTKTELQVMLVNRTAIVFHQYVCQSCHILPQQRQWIKAAETSHMGVFHVGKREGKFAQWEPIFIGTHEDPHYDERLSWEGKKDKMTQGYILCVKEYDFMILNNAFLVHKPGIKRQKKNLMRDHQTTKQGNFISEVLTPEFKKLFGTKAGCAL